MSPRTTKTDSDTGDSPLPDGAPGSVSRRAPFSANPEVGIRGQRTQQRILDAALQVFDEQGYHQGSVDRITGLAGCSRASFYQYFSSKEDVFRHLAGQLAREVTDSIDGIEPLGADGESRTALRNWLTHYAELYRRYEPVFHTAQTAAESDEAIAGGYARAGERVVGRFGGRLGETTVSGRALEAVIALLLESLPRAFADLAILQLATPGTMSEDRFIDAVTDIMHRSFFGRMNPVNVHPAVADPPPPLRFSDRTWQAIREDLSQGRSPRSDSPTLRALMDAGREVFVARGYHGARIDDVVEGAGVSHGAFYRYFDSKDQFVQLLALRSMQTVATAFLQVPDLDTIGRDAGRTALRQWLRHYNTSQAAAAAMIRVWADASLHDPTLRADSAAVLDWGRRQMADFLRPRGFGDADVEATVLVAMLGAFGARKRSTPGVEAAAHVIERGFLGA